LVTDLFTPINKWKVKIVNKMNLKLYKRNIQSLSNCYWILNYWRKFQVFRKHWRKTIGNIKLLK